MSRVITHASLVKFHRDIATAHLGINGFYRFNWNEINGQFRSGIGVPALLLESHSFDMENQSKTSNFKNNRVSFMVLNFTGKADAYDKQEEVLDNLENVAIDIMAYLVSQHKDKDSFLFGKLDVNSMECEKVGPVFDNMYGWNVIYSLKNHEPLCYEPDKWDWTAVTT